MLETGCGRARGGADGPADDAVGMVAHVDGYPTLGVTDERTKVRPEHPLWSMWQVINGDDANSARVRSVGANGEVRCPAEVRAAPPSGRRQQT